MVRLSQLITAFNAFKVVDDVYKFRLYYFAVWVLNAVEGKLYIRNDLLSIVEDVEFFFKYP